MHPDWILLEKMFEKHRQEAFVSCDEKCFCWDVEKLLLRRTFAEACAYDEPCKQCIHYACANFPKGNYE